MSDRPPKARTSLLVAAALGAAAPVAYGFFSTEFRGLSTPDGSVIEVRVPGGTTSGGVALLLEAAGLISRPGVFNAYVRLHGQARALKAGRYEIPSGASYAHLLGTLRSGAVATRALTIPEGLMITEIAERLAAYTGDSAAAVQAFLVDPARVGELNVPGPALEGYLFPETYRFAEGVGLPVIVAAMVGRYRAFWGDGERAAAAALGLDEREIVTLASIVEKEVRRGDERPVVAGVYWNRLQAGMLLQADPTVQYALGEPRARLLYRDIDAVADHPYNTYKQPGLPPGPIASPGAASLRAALQPADHEYIFFVARADGSHEFTRTLSEHNAAIRRIRLGRQAAER